MGKKRIRRITIRMNDVEYEHLQRDAMHAGQTMSGYVRMLFYRYMNVPVR